MVFPADLIAAFGSESTFPQNAINNAFVRRVFIIRRSRRGRGGEFIPAGCVLVDDPFLAFYAGPGSLGECRLRIGKAACVDGGLTAHTKEGTQPGGAFT